MKIEEKKKKEEEKMRPKRYRIATVIDFYIVLRSVFFVRHPVSICFKNLDTIYAPLGVLFVALHIFISLLWVSHFLFLLALL